MAEERRVSVETTTLESNTVNREAARLAGILIIKLIDKASLLSNLRPRNTATVKPDRLKPGKIAIPWNKPTIMASLIDKLDRSLVPISFFINCIPPVINIKKPTVIIAETPSFDENSSPINNIGKATIKLVIEANKIKMNNGDGEMGKVNTSETRDCISRLKTTIEAVAVPRCNHKA